MPVCASCGQENPEGFGFCGRCGSPIASAAARREQRKVVTVLFCDVTGSTALGERLDPESLRALLAGYFERMKAIVERHGGTVEKFIGDAVMAVFGVPVLHEDDALRALRAAAEMLEALPGLGVEGRIGVATGEVVTGTAERLATGDAVNVAARLEQAAVPGEILIGEETYRLTREGVEAEPVVPLSLKGKAESVSAYRLVAVGGEAGFARHLDAPMVGRERELRFNLRTDLSSTDPVLAADPTAWQLLYATCANLLNYPDAPAPTGSHLVPEVAESVPAPSDQGRSYAFIIPPGFRFSPPSNQSVTARTFKYSIERALDRRMHNAYAQQLVSEITGEQTFVAGTAKHISGIAAHGHTLTIRLVHPQPDFLSRISQIFFCAVPTNTPINPHGVSAIPSAGPYYIASYIPGSRIVLKRNPNYHGSRPHRLAEIDYTIGVSPVRSLAQIEAGRADYTPDGVPSQANAGLAGRYGPGSRAARAGHQQYFIDPLLSVRMLSLNTTRPPFNDTKLRIAANYAIDRPALAAEEARYLGGANSAGSVNDAYLPPGVPGYPNVHVYPLHGPDLPRAQALASRTHHAAVLYTCNRPPCPQDAQIIRTDLRWIGIAVEVKEFPIGVLYDRISKPGEPFDIATTAWVLGYPDPADLFNNPTNEFMYSRFHDPAYLHRLQAAAQLTPPARYRAYAHLAVDLAKNAAPWVVIENDTNRDFFSARIGCQIYQPVYGIDLGALCLRR